MQQRRSRARAKALALVTTMMLVFSFFGLFSSPSVSKADFSTQTNFNVCAASDQGVDLTGISCCPTLNFNIPGNCCPAPGFTSVNICEVAPVPVPPQAHLIGSLWVTPDRTVANNLETVLAVNFKVSNVGAGNSSAEYLYMPFSSSLVAGYTTFSDSGMWVSNLNSDNLTVNLPDLAPGKSLEGTIFFRPNTQNMPVNGQKVTFGFDVTYNDSVGQEVSHSNESTVSFEAQNTDETVGKVMEMTPAALDATAGDKVEATAKSFAPGEKVSSWVTAADGTSKAIADDRADYNTGDYTVVVDTTGFAAGKYVIAVYGHDSEITFRAVLTVK
jgi:hypothetical protein